MLFAATGMNLAIIILSKSEEEWQKSHDITYMWNFKNDRVEREVEGGSGWRIHVNPWLIHVNV